MAEAIFASLSAGAFSAGAWAEADAFFACGAVGTFGGFVDFSVTIVVFAIVANLRMACVYAVYDK